MLTEALNTLHLADLTRGDMIGAGTHAPLRPNDAIHLAVAIRLGVDEFVTYDDELAQAARTAGLAVFALALSRRAARPPATSGRQATTKG